MGAAQVRRGGALLQQGSLPLSVDRERLVALFGEVGEVTALGELLPELPPETELVERLTTGLAKALDVTLESGELSARETAAVRGLKAAGENTRSPGRRAALDST